MGKEPEFTKTVCVRLEPELVETLQALADAEDRTLSQFIRRELKAIGARHAKQSGGQG
jgi:predicted transcriptional regulator